MDAPTLQKYLNCFSSLRVKYDTIKGSAPHKPILLLGLIDEVERGHIADNYVPLSDNPAGNQISLLDNLIAAVYAQWQALPIGGWELLDGPQPTPIYNPFYYLANDTCPQDGKFWFLFKAGVSVPATDDNRPRSLNDLKRKVDYAQFAPDLWLLLQDAVARNALRVHLLETYFGKATADAPSVQPAAVLAAQLDKLIAEAESKPKPKSDKTKEESGMYHVRHARFPDLVRDIYEDACAVCQLHVRIGLRTVIEAAHIKPFALSHSDHPSNGLALCRNHHWIFDGGGFSVSDDYTLFVSPQLTGTANFVIPGAPLRLPMFPNCYPDPAVLAWHRRKHKFPK